jgi:hypothetical protein
MLPCHRLPEYDPVIITPEPVQTDTEDTVETVETVLDE